MESEKIVVRGARVHNLKNIDVEIPKNKFTVMTGLSGSGKSSLAFDTIYAEGQRRYMESISSYARQFIGMMDKPEVESISGLSPTIAINQRNISNNPRSTVGTMTEIYDLLRLLFSRIGKPYCAKCAVEMTKKTVHQIIDELLLLPLKTEVLVLAPVNQEQIKKTKDIIDKIRKAGYIKVRLDNKVYNLREIQMDPHEIENGHTLEILVDKLNPHLDKNLLGKAIETSLDIGKGKLIVHRLDLQKDLIFSHHYTCPKCGAILNDPQPRFFSFNSPEGACPSCQGLGLKQQIDPRLVIPNTNLTINQGAIRPWARMFSNAKMLLLEKVAEKYHFSLNSPVKDLTVKDLKIIFSGTNSEKYQLGNSEVIFEGVAADLEKKYQEAKSDYLRRELEKYMRVSICSVCQGKRLKPEVLAIKLLNKNIAQLGDLSIEELKDFFAQLAGKSKNGLKEKEQRVATSIAKEIIRRLSFLENVGLNYLSMNRSATTLAGGEAQRIKLANQLGSNLSGLVYVLDEPSIGLHPRDVSKLIATIHELVKQKNTVIMVEHDREIMMAADKIIDLGPGAGDYGGKIISQGPLKKIKADKKSLTGQYLSNRLKIERASGIHVGIGKKISIKNAYAFNLKNISVDFPLGKLICLTGVSGSGKSTLMIEILAKALAHKFYHAKDLPAAHKEILGLGNIDKVVSVDQTPIGRTPHSNLATYTGVFSFIRDLFSQLPESKMRSYSPGHFSFNVEGGRCEACRGEGMLKVEMQFLPDVYIECEECGGTRYRKEILEVHYERKNIAQILDMSVEEARKFFSNQPTIFSKLDLLYEVGLGYVKLGQPAPTLSGGEAQRIKLATELSRKATGKTLYLLDEPTTGLHFADVKNLLRVLGKLVDAGNTVLIIEHNLDVIKCADWVIDLGPEGGDEGGYLVAQGTPEQVAKNKKSYTGQYLKKLF